MQRVLYLSESHIEEADAQLVVSQIVANAQINNARLGITGALIYTGEHFAQVLEGSPETIQMLMARIVADFRHQNVVVVDQSPIDGRRFPEWSLAYQGQSQFVSRHVTRLMNMTSQSEKRRASAWLTDLAHEFSLTETPSG